MSLFKSLNQRNHWVLEIEHDEIGLRGSLLVTHGIEFAANERFRLVS